MFKEFRDFAMRGNVLDMAVGIILGGAFGLVVKVLVSDVMMPPIGMLLGGVDFSNLFLVLQQGDPVGPYAALADAQAAGAVSINYGFWLNTVISFVIVAFAVFLLIRAVNQLKRAEEAPEGPPTKKKCQYCVSEIPIEATRCAFCTATL